MLHLCSTVHLIIIRLGNSLQRCDLPYMRVSSPLLRLLLCTGRNIRSWLFRVRCSLFSVVALLQRGFQERREETFFPTTPTRTSHPITHSSITICTISDILQSACNAIHLIALLIIILWHCCCLHLYLMIVSCSSSSKEVTLIIFNSATTRRISHHHLIKQHVINCSSQQQQPNNPLPTRHSPALTQQCLPNLHISAPRRQMDRPRGRSAIATCHLVLYRHV